MQQDPYRLRVPTDRLSRLAEALEVVDRHAEINHRYRKLIHDSREMLAAEDVRLTQARGMGKKLMVLVRAAGPDFREELEPEQRRSLDAGLAQADELVHGGGTGQDE
ncbi:hypothetical protein SAMN04487905_111181 [Actinopolyspora xinjiangensis]|uniref:Uncharacterized protein n=1 Tax=Actinopolyspora xinjiangensis TaxID=405564 RepID=A0A1H0WC71_9ACTN|nr:hypothetical protein [Actinopolyspora xinjiangensis]SDP88267.1 hypothetical protein SAMN04487905_111181 [Actinopolyspora xinjiangensis]